MLKRVLVANRGEIAARVLRACREMNIETVAVFSEADRGSLFTTLATRAVCVGGARAHESYLNQDAIITAALGTGCDAIHPGFGFLSENAHFAARVREVGLRFVGPTPEVIALLGNKDAARALMRKHGVPVVPGSDGCVSTAGEAREVAQHIGYPVLVKAAAGGGGRGMRRANDATQLERVFVEATAEAEACFGDGTVYLEKLIEIPRHIEVQVLADAHGNYLHLGERDCSLQRRHQKVLEEAPAAILSDSLRERMTVAALDAARAASYTNAGTVEFVLDGNGDFFFIEMNTRIQVEHPVTEMVTGVNIVREQLRVASGLPLRLAQGDIHIQGHAIECRINAEDPERDFRPCPGTIDYLHLPSGFGIRVDTVIHPGYEVSPFYDSMIAKIIVCGRTRNEAILRMRRALEETLITGIATNVRMHYLLMYDPDFLNNHIDTVIHPGYEVSPFYDSMIAKIIVCGRTRNEAILRMRRALEETLITGIATNIGMHYLLMYSPDFLNNHIDTSFLERNLDSLLAAAKGEGASAEEAGGRSAGDGGAAEDGAAGAGKSARAGGPAAAGAGENAEAGGAGGPAAAGAGESAEAGGAGGPAAAGAVRELMH